MGRKPEGSAEKMFKNLGKKIDALLQELNETKNQATEEYADNIEELKRNGASLKKGLHDIKENHKEQWEEVEGSLKNAGEELKNAFNATFSKKKED
jgi:phage host-nuclease inhibitor protein Gam